MYFILPVSFKINSFHPYISSTIIHKYFQQKPTCHEASWLPYWN